MKHAWLIKFWQGEARRYAEGAIECRERYDHYRKHRFWRSTGLHQSWFEAWQIDATKAEAYSLTARALMGLEE